MTKEEERRRMQNLCYEIIERRDAEMQSYTSSLGSRFETLTLYDYYIALKLQTIAVRLKITL